MCLNISNSRPIRYRSFCCKIENVSNVNQKHVSVSVDQNEVQKYRSVSNYIVRPRYACVYCANLSYFRARDLRRHLCRIHGEASDTLVQGSSFPAVNSVIRNATVEKMIKYLGFKNQLLLSVISTPEISVNNHTSVNTVENYSNRTSSSTSESISGPAELNWKRRIALAALTDATKVSSEVCSNELSILSESSLHCQFLFSLMKVLSLKMVSIKKYKNQTSRWCIRTK